MKIFTVYGMIILPLLVFVFFTGGVFAGETGPINYVVIFQAAEYDSKLGSTVEYFFKEVIKPGENLLLFTPQKPYNFSPQTRQAQPLDKLIQATKDVLKRDISTGAVGYDSIIEQMAMIVRNLETASSTEVRSLLIQYRQLSENLRNLRKLNEDLFMKLAQMFKQQPNETRLYIFYQAEIRVIPVAKTLDNLRRNPDVKFDVTQVFEGESTEELIDVEKVCRALEESKAKLYFIYMDTKGRRRQGLELKEFSGDIYNVFSKIAKETGGNVITSTNPAKALKTTVEK